MTHESPSSQQTASVDTLSPLLQELGEDQYGVAKSLRAVIETLRGETRPHMFGLLSMRLSVVASEIAHQRLPTLSFSDSTFVSTKQEILHSLQNAIATIEGGDTLVKGMEDSLVIEERARKQIVSTQARSQ